MAENTLLFFFPQPWPALIELSDERLLFSRSRNVQRFSVEATYKVLFFYKLAGCRRRAT
jgi:hypothetical protein